MVILRGLCTTRWQKQIACTNLTSNINTNSKLQNKIMDIKNIP